MSGNDAMGLKIFLCFLIVLASDVLILISAKKVDLEI
jgi:hypothetical protein